MANSPSAPAASADYSSRCVCRRDNRRLPAWNKVRPKSGPLMMLA
ncbi:MAG: hypothetical protein ACK5PF_03875 [bacterium]